MDNKYYTPKIEEFHVGFEYERYDFVNWNKGILTIEDLFSGSMEHGSALVSAIGCGHIRVKYLDIEDCVSLGWTHNRHDFEHIMGNYFTKDDYSFSIKDDCPLSIQQRYGDSCKFLFNGTVKNKSELKRLMEQLGI